MFILLLKQFLLKRLGGYMIKKMLINWLMPSLLDFLAKEAQDAANDPATNVDEAMVKAIKDYIAYRVEKALN
jgi:hypothetical protein